MHITIDNAIQQFIIDQELKNNSPQTIRYYQHDLRYLAEFLGHDKQIRELTLNDLKEYQLMLKNRIKLATHPIKPKTQKPITSTTIQTYLRAVRGFLGWLHNEGYILENLQAKFKLPKATKKTVEILSDEEIEKIFKSYNQNTEMGLRNSCLMALMLDCGLRRNEALYLNYDNVHITQGVIKVIGKGDKERIVPIGLYTKKLLIKYISGLRSDPVFDTKRLLIDRHLKPMSENCVKMLFERLKAKTGITRLHPHILRHTFATKFLMNGGDIFSLQQIMGHTSLDMVKKYSHIATSYMIQSHRKFSPLDNIEKSKYE